MQNNNPQLLLHIAIGDAVGRPFEFNTRQFIEHYNNLTYVDRVGEDNKGKGIYTDDTQMSIAVAAVLLKDAPLTHETFASMFQSIYHNDPREGYSRTIKKLIKFKKTSSFISNAAQIEPRSTNGCLMRTLPIGLYPDVNKVKHAAIIHCSLTHFTLEAIECTMLLSLLAHYYYHRIGDPSRAKYWLYEQVGTSLYDKVYGAWSNTKSEVSTNCTQTLSFCLQMMDIYDNMSDLLQACINAGGDVDSTASICLGLASINDAFSWNLPGNLYSDLENGEYGSDYLKRLDASLETAYPR